MGVGIGALPAVIIYGVSFLCALAGARLLEWTPQGRCEVLNARALAPDSTGGEGRKL
jgi:hypothetical protein